MLGKLIKYEWKAQGKVLGLGYLCIFILSLLAGIFKLAGKKMPHNAAIAGMQNMSTILAGVGIAALLIGTFSVAVMRYRKKLYKDQGYLMHTLPVTHMQLIFSKLIVSIVNMIFSAMVSFGCAELITNGEIVPLFSDETGKFYGDSRGIVLMLGLILAIVIQYILLICQAYASISIGYRASDNKDVISVFVFLGLYLVQQIVNSMGLLALVAVNFNTLDLKFETHYQMMLYLGTLFGLQIAVSIVFSVIYIFITNRNMNRHLNLE